MYHFKVKIIKNKPKGLKVVESDYMADRHDCQWSMGDWHDGR